MFDPVTDRLETSSKSSIFYLVDFLKLPLKSTNDYNDAFGDCITDINGRISLKRCGTYHS